MFSSLAHLYFIVSFSDSHAVLFFVLASQLTLCCQQPPIQIMKSACETVADECKHKLGSGVDCCVLETEGAFSHQPGLGNFEETPTLSLSSLLGEIVLIRTEKKRGVIRCTELRAQTHKLGT